MAQAPGLGLETGAARRQREPREMIAVRAQQFVVQSGKGRTDPSEHWRKSNRDPHAA